MEYDQHVVNTLTHFYLDPNKKLLYSDRWDTWLIAKDYMNEYFYLMLKPDIQLNIILTRAYNQAKVLQSSPLAKALEE